jgi:hypothetical protein
MKADFFLKQVLNKVNVPNKTELEEALARIPNLDIPDEFETVVQGFANLHTEDSAKSSKTLAEYHVNKHRDNATKAMTSKMQADGFETAEIDEVLRMPFEDRWQSIAGIVKEKERKNYSLTESERVKLAEDKAAREKERADRLQQVNIEKEINMKRQWEDQLMEYDLHGFVSNMAFNDNLPKDKAVKLVVDEVKSKLNGANAKLTRSGNQLRLVQADDTALDFYDERNNPVYLQAFVENVMQENNLFRKRDAPKQTTANLRNALLQNPGVKPNGVQNMVNNQIRSVLNTR